jgi:hypothetical protein
LITDSEKYLKGYFYMVDRYNTTRQWYAIHTYSGYEEKVAESIRQRADRGQER